MSKWKQLQEAIKNDFNDTSRYYNRIPSETDHLRPSGSAIANETRSPLAIEYAIDVFHRNFRSIPASPKNGGLYRIVYVYPEDIPQVMKGDINTLLSPTLISQSPKVINDPSFDPAELARRFANRALSIVHSFRPTECHIISGERGVGKTAFLNHLFSTQHAIFDEQEVIWIRIDMTLAEVFEYTLKELLDIHAYDILSTHYIAGGEFPKNEDYFDDIDFNHSLKEYEKRKQRFSIDAINQFCQTIPAEDPEEKDLADQLILLPPGKIKSSDIDFGEKIKRMRLYRRFIASLGYSFIYVFDGLDEATIQMQRQELLNRWRQNLLDIMQGKNVPDGLYFLCARNESFRTFISHMQSDSSPRDLQHWIIHPVPIKNIIERRLDLFEERIQRKDKRISVKYWTPGSAKLLVDLALFMIRCAFRDIGIDEDTLEVFSQSGHMRSVLKFFRDVLWEAMAVIDEKYIKVFLFPGIAEFLVQNPEFKKTLEDLVQRKSYRVWTVSSLSYENYFERSIEFDGEKKKLFYPSEVGEFPLLPIVWGDIEFSPDQEYFNNHLLLKIRILELMNSNRQRPITFDLIKITISKIFQHNPENVEIVIKAMMLQRLIDLSPDQECLQKLHTSRIRITDLGSRILEKWIFIPEYVESTMNYAAIPSSVAKELPRFFIQRKGGPLSVVKDSDSMPTADYLCRLFPELAKFVSVISAIERWELTRLKMFRGSQEDTEITFNPMGISQKMKENMLQRLNIILSSAEKNQLGKLFSKLANQYGVTLEQE